MEESNITTIATFDFDGTLTTKDTLIDFLIFNFGKAKVLFGFIILSPILISLKLKLIKNSKAKQILFSYFFKNHSEAEFNDNCSSYSKRIDTICNTETLDRLRWHLKQNHKVVIISASIRNWIEPWALKNGIDIVLGTEIEIAKNIITGKFRSKNCYGIEKVNRLLEKYPNRNAYTLYAYGDSRGDKELLELADHPNYIK